MKPLKINEETDSVTQRTDAILQAYVASLENMLHQYPHQWFNYYPFWGENKRG